jgi:hypothetical protein
MSSVAGRLRGSRRFMDARDHLLLRVSERTGALAHVGVPSDDVQRRAGSCDIVATNST